MPDINSIGDAKVSIAAILSSLEEPTYGFVSSAIAEPSPIDTIMQSLEALYAAEEKTNEQRQLIVDLLNFAIPHSWYGINTDNRGARMLRAMCRDLGQTAPSGNPWPDADSDPAPSDRYKADQPTPATPVPAPVEQPEA